MNIVIVGGGTAGWMAASWFIKKNKNVNVTLIESPDIPKIGVGESVTPHVDSFFMEMGVPESDWMYHTGAIHKLANKFVGWKTGNNESEYFSFNYTADSILFHKESSVPLTKNDWIIKNQKNTDYVLELFNRGKIEGFSKHFHTQYHYMEKNVAPFIGQEYLLNTLHSKSHHINAELTADYIRDTIAKPLGVKHVQAKVLRVHVDGEDISKLDLDNGQQITADLFVDCSGLRRLLVTELNWKIKEYPNSPIDRALVCQLDYSDPEKEIVNYTQSIAQPHGWMFKISLYHRMGAGYIHSSKHVSEQQALDRFLSQISHHHRRFEPRLIKWTPSRLEKVGNGNTVAIGLSYGFVEPMEANALYSIITSIGRVSNVIDGYQGSFDWNEVNNDIGYSMDDISDFAIAHYSLSQRTDTDFWLDMQQFKKEHTEMLFEKYVSPNHTLHKCTKGVSLFPDYMWAHLAQSWGIDTSSWVKGLDEETLKLAELYYNYQEQKHKINSNLAKNNYLWLRENMFRGMSSQEWEQHVLKK